jgi:hypothetical protein
MVAAERKGVFPRWAPQMGVDEHGRPCVERWVCSNMRELERVARIGGVR